MTFVLLLALAVVGTARPAWSMLRLVVDLVSGHDDDEEADL